MRCEHAFDDGAYVLGALSPGERDRYEAHLAQCVECREAVASLAVLPGLLGRLSAADAERPGRSEFVTEQRLPKLVRTVARSRRRQRWRVVAVAGVSACVAMFAGLAAGSARHAAPPSTQVSPSSQPTPMWAMRRVATTAVTAQVAVSESDAGTTVTMRCAYPPSDKPARPYVFRLVAVGQDGVSEQIGSWMAGAGDEVLVTGTVRWSLNDLTRVELRSKDGTPLLTYEVP